ncbi:Spy/CpxP family protein refolding chaperone [Rhodanobacter panaciterrae]|nr:Spy/CpxP family protein refolding chaperone [Rhodanobacter panaciterrae]
MNNVIRNIAVPALLTLAMCSTAAWAQQATTAPATASPSAASATHHAQKRADAVEERISDMHTQLKITDQQSKQWDAFAQTMRDNAKKAADAFHERAQKLPTMNADEAMKSYAALTQLHAENMQKLSAAMSDLYAVLSPDQKQTADTMYRNDHPKSHKTMHKQKSGTPANATPAATPVSG